MNVTEIEAIPLESPVEAVRMKAGVNEQSVAVLPVLVTVHTDAGITGLGETLTYDPTGEEARYTAQGIRSLAR
ncbi:MAG: mandelate racemase/muconate lactonizing enzyme family protein, partial [Halobacteriota archaeon]